MADYLEDATASSSSSSSSFVPTPTHRPRRLMGRYPVQDTPIYLGKRRPYQIKYGRSNIAEMEDQIADEPVLLPPKDRVIEKVESYSEMPASRPFMRARAHLGLAEAFARMDEPAFSSPSIEVSSPTLQLDRMDKAKKLYKQERDKEIWEFEEQPPPVPARIPSPVQSPVRSPSPVPSLVRSPSPEPRRRVYNSLARSKLINTAKKHSAAEDARIIAAKFNDTVDDSLLDEYAALEQDFPDEEPPDFDEKVRRMGERLGNTVYNLRDARHGVERLLEPLELEQFADDEPVQLVVQIPHPSPTKNVEPIATVPSKPVTEPTLSAPAPSSGQPTIQIPIQASGQITSQHSVQLPIHSSGQANGQPTIIIIEHRHVHSFQLSGVKFPALYTTTDSPSPSGVWNRNWKFTWAGFFLFSFAAWLLLESLVCGAYGYPTSSTKSSWKHNAPSFPFAFPVRLNQWTGSVVSRTFSHTHEYIMELLNPSAAKMRYYSHPSVPNGSNDWWVGGDGDGPVGIRMPEASTFDDDEVI
jgi:hypothetical protein